MVRNRDGALSARWRDTSKLTVLHEAVEGNPIDDGLRNGWPAILSSLKSYLETGDGLEVTRQWAREGR